MSALAIIGEMQRARDLMERLLRIASPLGLYAEEFDADTGRHLGNFPQAFSHLALIEAAARIIVPERLGGDALMDAYDVIIIGTGAGGGTLARHLAPSGKRILLLERGDWLPREPQNWLAQDVFVDNRYVSPDTWYDADGKPFQPQVHYFVGGATKLYGAALYRLREEDFGELRHHDGISPAWPISYDELEPYYTQAEQLYEVHGARGEDPTEPPASAPYPFPAVSHEPRIQQLSDDLAAAGYHPFHAPCGDQARRGEHAVQHMRPLRDLRRLPVPRPREVRRRGARRAAGARAPERHAADEREGRQARDERGGHGRHRGRRRARRRDGALRRRHRGRLACGAANSAKLLLLSANDKHPNGLANGSDQVGRNYMFHDSEAVLALSREENPTVFQKTLGLNDFYFGSDDFEYPLGNIQMVGKSQAPMFRGERPGETKLAPEWTLERDRPARDRLLALDRGPAATREPGHRRPRRQAHAELHGDERRAEEAALREAQVDARQAGHEPGPPDPPLRVHEERHPGGRLRAPGGHVPVRQRPGDVGARTPTAGRTRSTTCTSSTRASSRASAPSTRR